MKRMVLICSVFLLGLAVVFQSSPTIAEDKKPVKFVLCAPLSGVLGSVPDIGYGLMDAAQYINDTGGIGGRDFVAIVEDGRYDVPTTSGIFHRYATSEPKDEFLFFSPFCSPCLKALTEEVNREEKIPVMAASMSSLIFDEDVQKKAPYFFSTGPGYEEQWAMVLKYIKENHKKSTPPRVALHYYDNSTGREIHDLLKRYAKKYGLDMVMMEPFSPTAQSFAPSFMKFRKEKIEYVLFWNWSFKVGARYFKEAKKYIPNIPTYGVHWTAANLFFYLSGDAYDGHYVVCGYPTETELDNSFVKMVTDMAAKNGRKIKTWTFYMQSWIMAQLAAESARQTLEAGLPLTRENVRNSMENINTDLSGMFGGNKLDYTTHKFSQARMLRADFSKKTLVPMTDWVDIYDYIK